MKEIFLLKNGEIALKGKNRAKFEDILIKNIRYRLVPFGEFDIKKSQSAIVVEPKNDNIDYDEVDEALHQVFGIASICRARLSEKDIESVANAAVELIEKSGINPSTFKVESKRSDKKFPLTSPEISREVGGKILSKMPKLNVDVHTPDIQVIVEIRDHAAYVHTGNVLAKGGMPVGTAGKAALMLSGGIDSPVAGYMIASRGAQLVAVHFESPPYTSKRAFLKVKTLAEEVSKYSGQILLCSVPFTKIQEAIKENCDESYSTVLMRRIMCMITERMARKNGCQAMVTGESLGQVASQTMEAIYCTDNAADMPIFRPLIGMDKRDIIKIAKDIGTYETSILPYEDCCTVFTPKHPKTRPQLHKVMIEEGKLDLDNLIEEAINETTFEKITLS